MNTSIVYMTRVCFDCDGVDRLYVCLSVCLLVFLIERYMANALKHVESCLILTKTICIRL